MIPSEQQAEAIGRAVTGGERDVDFTVFHYTHNRTKLTLFAVETADGNIISTLNPSAGGFRAATKERN